MKHTHAAIVPLIGGEVIAMENVFKVSPEYFLTYTGFQANESHLRQRYPEVPYLNLSEGQAPQKPYVDVVSTVCPCAGLSSLSMQASVDSAMNDWMYESAKYVLSTVKPKVFWGENAPRLGTKAGRPVADKLREIARENGYTFSIFKTRSLNHGLPQVRNRVFYFFWQGDQIPLLEYIDVEPISIEDHLRAVERREDDPMSQMLTNDAVPSDNPFYRYILDVIAGGLTHTEFQDTLDTSCNVLQYIEQHADYAEVGAWMSTNGYDKTAEKCQRMYDKLESGGNIMRRSPIIPKDKIGAFVAHLPTSLVHPDEDRYITVREALSLMALPDDFQMIDPKRNLNHMCQNVPVTTAEWPAAMIKKHLNGELELVDTDFLIQNNLNQTFEDLGDHPTPEAFTDIFK